MPNYRRLTLIGLLWIWICLPVMAVEQGSHDNSEASHGRTNSLLIGLKGSDKKPVLKQKSVVDSLPVSYYLLIIGLFIVAIVITVNNKRKAHVTGNASPFRIITQLPLGMKESLQIIEIYGEQIVIARTANGIQKIHQLSAEQVKINHAQTQPTQAADVTGSNTQSSAPDLFHQLLQSMKVNN